jgi:hypothetical protein
MMNVKKSLTERVERSENAILALLEFIRIHDQEIKRLKDSVIPKQCACLNKVEGGSRAN